MFFLRKFFIPFNAPRVIKIGYNRFFLLKNIILYYFFKTPFVEKNSLLDNQHNWVVIYFLKSRSILIFLWKFENLKKMYLKCWIYEFFYIFCSVYLIKHTLFNKKNYNTWSINLKIKVNHKNYINWVKNTVTNFTCF